MHKKSVHAVVSNEVRTKIVACLGSGTKTVRELCAVCRLSQSAVSQHLMKLRAAGVVKSTVKGRDHIYSVTDKKIVNVCRSIMSLIK